MSAAELDDGAIVVNVHIRMDPVAVLARREIAALVAQAIACSGQRRGVIRPERTTSGNPTEVGGLAPPTCCRPPEVSP